ncbi:MAG: hypothetical protein HY922_03995 [Elusimicrobia bacterium]|nr:hypothetical protein [Elusimicrobiota bacterium]
MRRVSGFLLLALASAAQAGSIESLRSSAEQFRPSPASEAQVPTIAQAGPAQKIEVIKPGFFKPRFGPKSAPLASFSLAERLDAHRDMLSMQLGANVWNVGIAADSAVATGYFTFQRADILRIERMNFDELRHAGSVFKLDSATTYRAKVEVSLLNPVYGSELHATPEPGTQGPRHKIKTGRILAALKQKSVVFSLAGKEYWVLYGTDVDPSTDQLARTRTLLFIHVAGLDSKAWPVAESSLPENQLTGVSLGDAKIALSKGSDGSLRIYSQ